MPLPSFLQVFNKMGAASSQPARDQDDSEFSQDIVPETPRPPTVNGMKKQKASNSSKPNLSSSSIPGTNGTVTPPDSDTSNPSKRKRESEPERKKNAKKNRKSGKFIEEDPDSEPSLEPTITAAAEIPPTPSQPTSSKSERSQAKKARKQKKKDAQSPTTPTAQPASDMSPAEVLSDAEQATFANPTSAPVTPKPEGSLTPGGRPRISRGSRKREKDSLKIGFYTPEEVEKIETFKVNFCTTHSLSSTTFDEMVQHSERGGNGDFPVSTDVITKGDFWEEIYGLVPDRDRRSVYRFMRRHFQASAQKAHDWSKEQEDELISLYARHGPKWTFIGKLLGRSDDDVTQRWKNKLEHKGTMNQGAWSEDETQTFLDAMKSSWVNMKPLLEEQSGNDFYDLDEKLVVWGNVSKAMGHRRSRQQCADKWRKIVKQVRRLRANGMPDAVFDVQAAAKSVANWNGRLAANKKSAAFVNEDDDDDDVNGGPESTNPNSETKPGLANLLSNIAQSVSQSENEAEPDHGVQSEAEPEPEPELTQQTNKSKKSKTKRKRTEEAVSDAAGQPDNETQAEVDGDPELPPTLKESKRRHTQNTSSDAVEESPSSSLANPKKSKAERKREKKEQKEQQERENQAESEAKAKKDARAARKKAKRQKKEEEARLAAQAETPEPPKNKKTSKKSKQAYNDDTDNHSAAHTGEISPSKSTSPNLPAGLFSAAAEATDQDGSDSDGVDEGDVPVKFESESDEL